MAALWTAFWLMWLLLVGWAILVRLAWNAIRPRAGRSR